MANKEIYDETRSTGNPAEEGIRAAQRDAAGTRWPAIVLNEAGHRMIQVANDFRHAESAEPVRRHDGTLIWMLYCEELVEGRWEPFSSVVRQ